MTRAYFDASMQDEAEDSEAATMPAVGFYFTARAIG
jgi:hypothetical protein